MLFTVPAQGHREARWKEKSLVLLFSSVFNVIQKKNLKTNLPYFVLGPVFPGCSQIRAATLQRPWQLTSSGQRKLQSPWCHARRHFLSTSFQGASFEDGAGACVTVGAWGRDATQTGPAGLWVTWATPPLHPHRPVAPLSCWCGGRLLDFLIYDSFFMLFMCIINCFVHSTLNRWTWARDELFSKILPSFSK